MLGGRLDQKSVGRRKGDHRRLMLAGEYIGAGHHLLQQGGHLFRLRILQKERLYFDIGDRSVECAHQMHHLT